MRRQKRSRFCGRSDRVPRKGPRAKPKTDETAKEGYRPLITVFLLLIAATAAVSWNDLRAGNFSREKTLEAFMAGFFRGVLAEAFPEKIISFFEVVL